MTREELRARDLARLAATHPDLHGRCVTILLTMDAFQHPMTVTAAVREDAEQQALYAKGRTAPGSIVTNADGILKRSNHQRKADGMGHAVDMAFLVDGPDRDSELDTPSWDESHPWAVYGALAEALGLTWGGRWPTLRDLPHIERKG
jgi:peptidoglycan L-alanyl-D-glutamate endopeptidase CwlK